MDLTQQGGWFTLTVQHVLVLSLNYVTLFYIAVALVVLFLLFGRLKKR